MPAVLAALALVGCSTAAAARPHCRAATEQAPRLCSIRLPAVQRVVVAHPPDGQTQGPGAGADCAAFRLSPALVRRYLSSAWRVEDPRGEEAVDRGPCAAEGSLVWANGHKAQWRIEQIGTGTLVMDNGRPPITLYCLRCNFAPFRP